jgi:hypothetical protein
LTSLLKDFEDLNHLNNQQTQIASSSIQPQSQALTQSQTAQAGITQTIASNQQSASLNLASSLNANAISLEQKQTSEQQSSQMLQQQSIDAFGISPTNTSRIKRKQFVAMIILGLIGAEFGQDVNSSNSQGPYKTIPQGFSMEDHSILKRISNKPLCAYYLWQFCLGVFFLLFFLFIKAPLFRI